MFRAIALFCLLGLFSNPVLAEPRIYDFDYGASNVEFIYEYNGEAIKGKFPKFRGDLLIDFKDIRNSKINVSIDARSAQGGFVFATSALRSAKVLYVKKFPSIKFRSTSARLKNGIAQINGQITVRGVTQPITLTAQFFKLEGHSPEDRKNLAVRISGSLNRHDFGASGYPKMVGKTLKINIIARIKLRS